MSKAILVIDNPNRCADCPLRCSVGGVQPFCSKTFQTLSDDEYYNKKPDWCPLREVPQKKEEHPREHYEFGSLGVAFVSGYNACIDEIMKGSEENG